MYPEQLVAPMRSDLTSAGFTELKTSKEVEENGLNVGETTRILVEKVEELTLYIIEQQELIEKQSIRLNELEEKLK